MYLVDLRKVCCVLTKFTPTISRDYLTWAERTDRKAFWIPTAGRIELALRFMGSSATPARLFPKLNRAGSRKYRRKMLSEHAARTRDRTERAKQRNWKKNKNKICFEKAFQPYRRMNRTTEPCFFFDNWVKQLFVWADARDWGPFSPVKLCCTMTVLCRTTYLRNQSCNCHVVCILVRMGLLLLIVFARV